MNRRVMAVLVFALAPALGCASDDSKIFRGHVVIGPEVETFRPCGSKTGLSLDYDEKTRAPLAAKHRALVKDIYKDTFVVLQGVVGPKLDCGFCESYEGSFKVSRVLEHRVASPEDCGK
jgi:hypothetical protein